MPDRATAIATAFELSLLLVGGILLWRVALSPAARRRTLAPVLARWDAPAADFFLFLWLVCGGGFAASFLIGTLLKFHPLSSNGTIAAATAAGQLGVLVGIGIFKKFFDHHKSPPVTPTHHPVKTGLATFLIAMPVVAATSLIWQSLLEFSGVPAEKQDLIRMFLEVKSPLLLVLMMILACIGAPIMEELVFRAGIFRYARTRLPRWATLLVPACLFAALHNNLASFAPLVALGVLFSLAYERTGRIATSIVAHALFNLNSLVLLLAKVDI